MRAAIAALVVMFCAGTRAQAGVTITIQEVGVDVVGTATGSLDITSLSGHRTAQGAGALVYTSSSNWLFAVGSGSADSFYVGTWVTAQPLFSSAQAHVATSNSGLPVGVVRAGVAFPDRVQVPAGYVSGTPINGSSTWSGQSLASLGLTPGTYVFDYGTDTVTFRVLATPVVPAQSTFGLILAGLMLAAAGVWAIGTRTWS